MKRENYPGTRDDHPAYGILDIARTTGSVALVGSAIKHHQFISITICKAHRNRNHNEDQFFQDDEIVEVWLSPIQWAEAICSMNTSGVPCTIKHIRGESMPEPEIDHARERVTKEFAEDVQHVAKELDEIQAFIHQLADQPRVGKGDLAKLKEMIRQARQDISCDLPFVAKQFNETVEKTVAQAKGEFEAYVLYRALHMANAGLVENALGNEVKPPELQLEGPES